MTDFVVSELPRLFSAAEATTMIGGNVDAAVPNVTSPTVAVDADTKLPVFAYLPLGDIAELRRAIVLGTKYGENMIRANGVRNRSRTFGYSPRRPVYRREGCASTTLSREAPGPHEVICGFSDRLAVMLEDISPEIAQSGRDAVAVVEPDWRLGESKMWTSGVINQSAVLPWHRDAFNFPAWSAMPVLRRHIDGGYLRIPEYGATVGCRDGWAVFFAGYELIHGVTPMRLRQPDGYRYSVVYYALKGMKNCFEAAVETAYARKRRTEREQDMAARLADGEPVENGLPPSSTRKMQGQRIMGNRGQSDFDQVAAAPDPRATSGLRKGRTAGGRVIGGTVAFDGRPDFEDRDGAPDRAEREAGTRPGVVVPRGRPAGWSPKVKSKKGFRLMGGVGQGTYNQEQAAAATSAGSRVSRIDRTGDPTAIEDAYIAETEGDDVAGE